MACVLCLALAAPSVAAQAPAGPRTSSLSWVRLPGAESCVSTQHLASAVEKRIGRRAFVSASQADISLEGRVERLEHEGRLRWKATLIVSDPRGTILGQRVLHADGDDCDVLRPSLTLVVAIAIDPGATLPSVLGPGDALSQDAQAMLDQLDLPEAGDRELIEQLTVPEPAARARSEPAHGSTPPAHQGPAAAAPPAPPAPAPAELELGLGAQLESGSLPSLAPGAALWAAYLPSPGFAAELALEGLISPDHAVGDVASADLSLLRGALSACLSSDPGRSLSGRLCGGAALGIIRVQPVDFNEDSGARSSLWGALRLAARGLLSLDPWLLHVGLRAGLPLTRGRLRYQDEADALHTLHRPAALTLSAELGVGVRFR